MSEFYVDVGDSNSANYVFYYNINKLISNGINEAVRKVIGTEAEKGLAKDGYDYARMVQFNLETGQVEDNEEHFEMQGITASINKELAEEVLQRAIYYCPKDTGFLASSGRIEQNNDGSCRIYFDCGYAWYVHEFSWKQHEFPTCDHFLTRAIYEVQKEHDFGWA